MDQQLQPPRLFATENLPVIATVTEGYKRWHGTLPHMARLTRYSLGQHIDGLFIRLLEAILAAGFAERAHKPECLEKASVTLDCLKLFLQVAWELKAIDNKAFANVGGPLVEAGKMLGGWKKQVSKTPPL